MTTDEYTLKHNTLGQAYIIWQGGKRIAIFPYGKGKEDATQDTARKLAMSLYNALEKKGDSR